MTRLMLVGAGIAVLCATSALAADLPPMAAYKAPMAAAAPSWSGIYIGIGVGDRAAQTNASMTSLLFVTPSGTTDFVALCPTCSNGADLNGTSFRVGPYIGVNWQFSQQWVAGFEADWAWGNQTTTLQGSYYPTGVVTTGLAVDSFAVQTTWDASARARLGFLLNPSVMIYATGGAAWLHVAASSTCGSGFLFAFPCTGGPPIPTDLNLFAPAVLTNERTLLGPTIGAGVETMLGSGWFLRAEYRYANFGTVNNSGVRTCASPCVNGGTSAPSAQVAAYDLRVQTHMATFGLAYKLY